jgi:hypothetical protein
VAATLLGACAPGHTTRSREAVTEADGGFVVGSTNRFYYYYDLYRLSTSTLLASFEIGQPPVRPYGAAFDPRATKLFVVAADDQGTLRFSVLDPNKRNTTLSASSDPPIVDYGAQTVIKVSLGLHRDMVNRTVRVYGWEAGSHERFLLTETEVDADGDLSVAYQPEISTGFGVEYDGDDRYTSQRASTGVGVRAFLGLMLSGHYSRQGLYFLYHDDDRVRISARLTPKVPDTMVTLTIERRKDGAWKTYAIEHPWTDEQGTASWSSATLPRGRFRVQGLSHPSGYAEARSAWKFFRVTP